MFDDNELNRRYAQPGADDEAFLDSLTEREWARAERVIERIREICRRHPGS
jgi:hypothetical protein